MQSKNSMSDIMTHIEILWLVNDEISEIINILDTNPEISETDKKNIVQHLVRDFWQKTRKDWSPYINHLKHTVIWVSEQYNGKPPRIALLIALLHDSIEDTRFKYERIRDIFWVEVALGVEFLSKKAFWKFIWKVPDISDEESILHHNQLSVIFQLIGFQWINHEYQIHDWDVPPQLAELLKNLKAPYKKAQQDEYFSKFLSRDTIRSELQKLIRSKNIEINDAQIDMLVDTIIAVKISDRLHNLCTLTENHKKKLQETLWYMRWLIKDIIDTPLWHKVSTEISWLQHQY